MASEIEYAEWNSFLSRQAVMSESMNPIEISPIIFDLLDSAERTDTNTECYADC
jgi:hypothetical protein